MFLYLKNALRKPRTENCSKVNSTFSFG